MRSILAAVFLLTAVGSALAQSETPLGVHIGVATCGGSNCHGATQRLKTSSVAGNEYLIWSEQDKHHDAYNVLLQDRAIGIARALGLPDAANQKLCLDCHADNVPQELRGPEFKISDGVTCESCHGGASRWLGVHISGATHEQNIAAGLTAIDKPVVRAANCLTCHYGDANHFVGHRLYGAGHPRLAFELDTYTALEPAHFVDDAGYRKRKGLITHVQIWSTGQAVALVRRMDAVLDPGHAPRGFWPEFAFFDCQSCHHQNGAYIRPAAAGTGGATLVFDDANEEMLSLVATRIAPQVAGALSAHMQALQKATLTDWPTVRREATAVRDAAQSLVDELARHDFTGDEMRALVDALVARVVSDHDYQYAHDEQITMALRAITASLRSSSDVPAGQGEAIGKAMDAVYAASNGGAAVRQAAYLKALAELQRTIRQ